MGKKLQPYSPILHIRMLDLYNALVMGDRETIDRLTKLAHDEHQAYLIAVTESPKTNAEWDEWERRRKSV